MNVLVADDHELVREGLKVILKEEFDKVRIGEAGDSMETLNLAAAKKWDLILLDIMMPGLGIVGLIEEIKKNCPDTPILILTASSEIEYAVQTLKAGANGYITKQYATDDLLLAIRKVLAGETYISAEAAKGLAVALRDNAKSALPHQKLSPRELEIFCLIASGKSVKEIADDLCLSDKTVGTHLARIKEKTGFSNYVEMTRYAIQHKLVM